MPGQFVPTPKNLSARRGCSRVLRTGRNESRPLSGPRQIALRAVYKIPPETENEQRAKPNQDHSRLLNSSLSRGRLQGHVSIAASTIQHLRKVNSWRWTVQ